MQRLRRSTIVRHRYVKRLSLLLIVAVLIVGIAKLIAAPVHGSIQPVEKRLLGQHQPRPPVPKQLPASEATTNPYFQLHLPPGYSQPTAGSAAPGILFQQTILRPSAEGSQIVAIAIKPLPEGGIVNDTSYSSRLQSSHYHFTSARVAGSSVLIANDSQSPSVVGFWTHGQLLATISVSSGIASVNDSSNAAEVSTLSTLLSSWQWQ